MVLWNHYFHVELSILLVICLNILVLSHTKGVLVGITLLFVNVTFSMSLWRNLLCGCVSVSFASRSLQGCWVDHGIVNDNWSWSLVNLVFMTSVLTWNTHWLRFLKSKFLGWSLHQLLLLDHWSFGSLLAMSVTCRPSCSISCASYLLLFLLWRGVFLLTTHSITVIMNWVLWRLLSSLNDDLFRLGQAVLINVKTTAVSSLIVEL